MTLPATNRFIASLEKQVLNVFPKIWSNYNDVTNKKCDGRDKWKKTLIPIKKSMLGGSFVDINEG
jgi:hypothetical protein